ncbi:MAG: flagellar biosynthesis protein FlgC [Planctomycetes bacterium]|nr:flagellar biosynthesis protein FlgC [Planctomycetota bacterium]
MNTGLNASLSALQAFGNRQAIQANNIANVNTDGFKKQRGLMQEQLLQGVSLTVDRVDIAGPVRVDQTAQGPDEVEMSNTELSEEIPETMINQRSLEANADMVRTQDEMLGTILDMKA